MAGFDWPLGPLASTMLAKLTSTQWLQSDATGFKVLEGSKNTPHRGHLHCWANTDRVIYTYAREGTGDEPAQILSKFQGALVAAAALPSTRPPAKTASNASAVASALSAGPGSP